MSFSSASVSCLSDVTSKERLDTRDLDEVLERLASMEGTEETQEFEGLDDEQTSLLNALRDARKSIGKRVWDSGVTLISESAFKEYAMQSAEDLGFIGEMQNNPLVHCIDWDAWADNMQADFSSVEIDGITFFYSE